MKPASVSATSVIDRALTDMAVGSTPSTVQGWRPNSATNQPISAAIQGAGIITPASHRAGRGYFMPRKDDRQKK